MATDQCSGAQEADHETDVAADGGRSGAANIVGRKKELEVIQRVIMRSAERTAQLVEVIGDPGIGKTRLLDELCGRATRRGLVVLSGRAIAFEREVPFAVVVDALLGALRTLGVTVPRRVTGDDLALLRTAFPGLTGGNARVGPGAVRPGEVTDAVPAGVERQRLYRAVGTLIEFLGWDSGLVLVLDDIHVADTGSVEFVDYLLRHPPTIPFVLAVGYRPRQLSAPLSRVLAQLTAMQRTRLEPKLLTLDETGEMLGPGFGRAPRRRLYEMSGGNPFYLEILQRAHGGPAANTTARRPGSVLDDLDNAVSGELPSAISGEFAALGPQALVVARAAAVAGDPFDPELVTGIGELTDSETVAGLDELVARDLIRPMGASRRFSFRHPLVRGAAYQMTGAGWRLDAHARAARVLERRGATAVVRAHHVAHSARIGDSDATTVLVQAAESIQRTAPDLGASWLGTAIGLLPHTSSSRDQMIGLMLARARMLGVSGRFADSRDLLHEVLGLLGLLDQEPGERRAVAAILLATMERLLGRVDTAQARLTDELSRLADHNGRLAAGMRTELALGSVMCGRLDDARAWTQQASISTRDTARDTTQGTALDPDTAITFGVRAIADAHTGRPESARRHLRPARALLDSLPDDQAARQLSLFLVVSRAELALELHHDALRHASRGITLATRTGQNHLVIDLSIALTSAQSWLGRLADAAVTAEDMLETSSLLGREELQPIIFAGQAEIALWRGDARAALRLSRQATADDGGPGDYWWKDIPRAIFGWALLVNGDATGCVREITAAGGPDLAACQLPLRPLWCDLLVQAEAMLENHPAALRWAERARETASKVGLPGVTGHARLASARALCATGNPSGAVDEAEQAAEAFAALEWWGYEGKARHLLGVALSAVGQLDRAQREWGRAKELFAACGARRMRTQVLNEQRRLAARLPRRRRSTGTEAGGLTARERQIADLISLGHTNRQIAERLFLSPKTVETHLTRIFAKLGITSRSALAAASAQLDAPPAGASDATGTADD